jgi:hypothetical protein
MAESFFPLIQTDFWEAHGPLPRTPAERADYMTRTRNKLPFWFLSLVVLRILLSLASAAAVIYLFQPGRSLPQVVLAGLVWGAWDEFVWAKLRHHILMYDQTWDFIIIFMGWWTFATYMTAAEAGKLDLDSALEAIKRNPAYKAVQNAALSHEGWHTLWNDLTATPKLAPLAMFFYKHRTACMLDDCDMRMVEQWAGDYKEADASYVPDASEPKPMEPPKSPEK